MFYKMFAAFALLIAIGAGCSTNLNFGPDNGTDQGQVENPDDSGSICKDSCGNGVCEEIVCMGTGCSCAESADSCPQDCSETDGTNDQAPASSLIHVNSPADDAKISSPLTVTGEARGYWFFEASFPVKVYDSNNNLLGTGIATAQGDWMTEEFVPFTAVVNFTPSTTSTGRIVLEKDNPSGLPENDNSLIVPVKF